MRLLVQRVSRARVELAGPDPGGARPGQGAGQAVGEIGQGLLVLAGFGRADTLGLPGTRPWAALCAKLLELRIFPDDAGRLNRSLSETRGGLLLVSQFTLYADTRRGRRPSFTGAAAPEVARALYHRLALDLAAALAAAGAPPLAQGVFGAEMLLDFVNWGPVTILLDSAEFEG
ncbi:MAG: D-tyrosyl-tRNA(Tyr) deacylase [Desulfovibrio sp.]|nr:D-tyrosyl-tRNA(Tyr) deacylase [Desulfovibrio sp.]